MKKMLKEDFIKLVLFSALSILATVYVAFIDKNEKLAVLTKSFIYIIPIMTFLNNRGNLKKYGVTKILVKETIILSSCLVVYFGIEMFTSYVFTNVLYHISYIVDIFVLITEFLVLIILLFIRKIYRKIGFVIMLALITIMFVLISRAPEYYFVIYIFYTLLDIGLLTEIAFLAIHYKEKETDDF